MNTWISPSKNIINLRNDLLDLLKNRQLQHDEELAVHWIMISAAYPFWFHVAEVFGSFFTLQDTIAKADVINRVYKMYGERNTVQRCSLYVISSFVGWNVISNTELRGHYQKAKQIEIKSPKLLSLLAEAALLSAGTGNKRLPVALLNAHPAFFPFIYPEINAGAMQAENLRLRADSFAMGNEYLSLAGG
jgi:hypothetical protein